MINITELKTDKMNASLLSLYRLLERGNNSYDFSSVSTYIEEVLQPLVQHIQNYLSFDTDYFFPINVPVLNFTFTVSSDLNIKPIPRRLLKSSEKLDLKQINVGFTNLSRDIQFMGSNYLTAITNLYNTTRNITNTDSIYSSFMDFISKSGVYINNIVITSGITETELEVVEEEAEESASDIVDAFLEETIDVPSPIIETIPPTNPPTARIDTSDISDRIREIMQRGVDERNARARAEYEAKKEANDRAKAKAAADLKQAQERQAEAAARVEEAKQAAENASSVYQIVTEMPDAPTNTATYRAPDGTLITAVKDPTTGRITTDISKPDGTHITTTWNTEYGKELPGLGTTYTERTITRTETAPDGTTKTTTGVSRVSDDPEAPVGTDIILTATSHIEHADGTKQSGDDAIYEVRNEQYSEMDTTKEITDTAPTAVQDAYDQYEEASSDVDDAQQTLDAVQAETPSAPEESTVDESTVEAMAGGAAEALAEYGYSDEAQQAGYDAFMETYNETGDIDAAAEAAAEAASATDFGGD